MVAAREFGPWKRTNAAFNPIEVGGQLLRALLARGEPMMLRDLGRNAGMSAAKAHPYFVSFARLGLVEQERASGRYELGPSRTPAGASKHAPAQSGPRGYRSDCRARRPYRPDRGNCQCGAITARQLCASRSPAAVHVNMRTGSVMSIARHCDGARVRGLPAIENDRDLHRGRRRARQCRRRCREADVAQADGGGVGGGQAAGLARAVERPIPGVNAFSAPVFDHSGTIALAITSIGPSGTFNAEWDSPIAKSLLSCAAQVSDRLGFLSKAAHKAA